MASAKKRTPSIARGRTLKGTTSRTSAALKSSLLLLIPIVALIAALTRHVEPHQGEVPDWQPTAGTLAH